MTQQDGSQAFNTQAGMYSRYLPSYGRYGGLIGYSLDRLAVKKFGASSTSLTGAGIGGGIGYQYGGPLGGLIGMGAGALAQQSVAAAKDPGDIQLFRDPATGNSFPLVGFMPFPGMTELLPDWANPSLSDLFGGIF